MAAAEDLIDFSIIETQKENIQAIPSGRSAKALASVFSPVATKSPIHAQDANDGVRRLYEEELLKIDELDDPLDVYDRYVKWTLNTYPSAQATPQSQLLPLLERATKAFLSSAQYKNDIRYLKLWLHYIRFFSDAPREHFAYLSRHNIGDGLALFYEEFAAWLEGAGRWTQADEVYNLGVDRQARPQERLLRKFAEFQHRYESRPQSAAEPSSPALPTVRPALAAKIDPFAPSVTRDPQAQGPTPAAPAARKGKMEIFADAGQEARPASGDSSRGWENIGSLAERKKENTIGARPWHGEKMEGGKTNTGVPKMMIFKDQSMPTSISNTELKFAHRDALNVNPKTGRRERVFVSLEAIYPDPKNPNVEYCFEELRAAKRGWLQRDWSVKHDSKTVAKLASSDGPLTTITNPPANQLVTDSSKPVSLNDENDENAQVNGARKPVDMAKKLRQEEKANRTRKFKIMEVRAETQTIQTNLTSPRGPKLKRKKSAEPTMTVHTKAATDEIYEIFNQPLKTIEESESTKSDDESDDEDDYTSGGESTGTGRISTTTSEFGDETQEDLTQAKSISDETTENSTVWSEFTTSKHVPKHGLRDEDITPTNTLTTTSEMVAQDQDGPSASSQPDESRPEEVVTPTSPTPPISNAQTRFVPIPPEDCEVPTRPYRDPAHGAQHRLPFMTPIVEKTESSLGTATGKREKDYFTAKTPCPKTSQKKSSMSEMEDGPWSSPFQEVLDDAISVNEKIAQPKLKFDPPKASSIPKPTSVLRPGSNEKEDTRKGPIIKDTQCNPMDNQIRQTILEEIHPPLSSYEGYFDHRDTVFNKSTEIRKFCKSISNSKNGKTGNEKTASNICLPPVLSFRGVDSDYTIKGQIGEGAFAPVYLAEHSSTNTGPSAEDDAPPQMRKGAFASIQRRTLEAIKTELDPPSAWEFYILRAAKRRLGVSRASESIVEAYEMHLFQDEGYLVEAYSPRGTLLDAVNSARAHALADGATAPAGLDEPAAMWFIVELLRTVEALHRHGIIHGDLKPDNVLLRFDSPADGCDAYWDPAYRTDGAAGWAARGVTLIDFGRGIDMRAFAPTAHFVADWATGPADCPEMRAARPWTFHCDYHGLAGIAHTLLFGRYLETVEVAGVGAAGRTYRLKEGLKRWWQAELWGPLFQLLLNPGAAVAREEGGRLPVLKGLAECREAMEKWLVENAERGVGLKAMLRRVEERAGGKGR